MYLLEVLLPRGGEHLREAEAHALAGRRLVVCQPVAENWKHLAQHAFAELANQLAQAPARGLPRLSSSAALSPAMSLRMRCGRTRRRVLGVLATTVFQMCTAAWRTARRRDRFEARTPRRAGRGASARRGSASDALPCASVLMPSSSDPPSRLRTFPLVPAMRNIIEPMSSAALCPMMRQFSSDAVLDGRQEEAATVRCMRKLLHEHAARAERRVAHGFHLVRESGEHLGERLLQVGLEQVAKREGQEPKQGEVPLSHVRRDVVAPGEDLREHRLEVLLTEHGEALRQSLSRAAAPSSARRSAASA